MEVADSADMALITLDGILPGGALERCVIVVPNLSHNRHPTAQSSTQSKHDIHVQ